MKEKDIAFAVLAGGKSSRMGTDKSQLRFGEKTFLENILDAGAGFAERIVSLGDSELPLPEGVLTVKDEKKSTGPLEGIRQILRAVSCDACLVVATDMPFLTGTFLTYLAGRYSGSGNLVLTLNGHPEPLCSIYTRDCLPVIDELQRSGIRRPAMLFGRVPTVFLAMENTGFPAELLRNINEKEEYLALYQESQ